MKSKQRELKGEGERQQWKDHIYNLEKERDNIRLTHKGQSVKT
jgi:hypothetical protein